MYKCPGCGAGLRFDPASQKVVCDFCGRKMDPRDEELKYTVTASEHADVRPDENGFQAIVYSCPNCGGELYSTDETAATFCSYCGSSVLLESRIETIEKPQRIIPFKITKEDCEAAYKKQLGKAVFAPTSMKKSDKIQQFRGIYMPYWLYDYEFNGNIHGSGSVVTHRGNYEYTDRYHVNRDVAAGYKGLAYDAASNFSDSLSQASAPFITKESEEFTPSYMSGFYADVSDVPSSVYEKKAKKHASSHIADRAYSDSAFSKHGVKREVLENSIHLPDSAAEKGMFPVWFLASKSADGKRVSYAVVNGQTGKVAADLPIAFHKYIIGSLLLAIPIFALLNWFLVMTPLKLLGVSFFISLIGLIILNSQLNRTYIKEYNLDDAGLQAVAPSEDPKKAAAEAKIREREEKKRLKEKSKKGSSDVLIGALIVAAFIVFGAVDVLGASWLYYPLIGLVLVGGMIYSAISSHRAKQAEKLGIVTKAPTYSKMPVLWKPLAGIIVTAVMYLIDPVQDSWFYGAAIVSMALMLWSTFDIVKMHNKQTMRKLPQFNKRGGDR